VPWRLIALLALVSAFVLAGSAAGTGGFTRHAVHGQGVSLEVPSSWLVVDSTFPKEHVDRISQRNPRFAPYLAQLSQPGSPVKFIALDTATQNGFATNANVVVVRVQAGTTFALYRASLVAGLRSIATGPIRQQVVTIGGAHVVRVGYRIRIDLGRTRTVQTLQYAFLHGTKSVVVTYTTLPSLAAGYAATFARSAQSIRFSS